MEKAIGMGTHLQRYAVLGLMVQGLMVQGLVAVMLAGVVGFASPLWASVPARVLPAMSPTRQWADMYGTMGLQMAASGHLIAADNFLGRANVFQPQQADWQYVHGMVKEGLDEHEAAMACFKHVIEQKPKHAEAYYKLGLLEGRQGNTPAAIAHISKAIELAPDEALLHYDLGVFYASEDNYAQAAKATLRAAELDPNFAEAWNNHAYALANLGQFTQAVEAVDKALALSPDSAAALDTKGFALQGLKQFDQAAKVFEAALALDANIGEIHMHYGQTLEALARKPEALKAYETFLMLEPNAPDAPMIEKKVKVLRQQLVGFLQAEAEAKTAKDAAEKAEKPLGSTSFLTETNFRPASSSPSLKLLFQKQWHSLSLPELGWTENGGLSSPTPEHR